MTRVKQSRIYTISSKHAYCTLLGNIRRHRLSQADAGARVVEVHARPYHVLQRHTCCSYWCNNKINNTIKIKTIYKIYNI